jgi:hypothetical protein
MDYFRRIIWPEGRIFPAGGTRYRIPLKIAFTGRGSELLYDRKKLSHPYRSSGMGMDIGRIDLFIAFLFVIISLSG